MSNEFLKEGTANFQKGIESVGGKLSLTRERLVFKAHALNIQGGVMEIKLVDIHNVDKCFTKFLGLIPLLPNSFATITEKGTFKFVVNGRDKWIEAIISAKNV